MRRIISKLAEEVWILEQSISIVFLFTVRISAPICFRMVKSMVTSEICGMFSMRQVPLTKRVAGIIATAAFFAPLISISP